MKINSYTRVLWCEISHPCSSVVTIGLTLQQRFIIIADAPGNPDRPLLLLVVWLDFFDRVVSTCG